MRDAVENKWNWILKKLKTMELSGIEEFLYSECLQDDSTQKNHLNHLYDQVLANAKLVDGVVDLRCG